MVAFSFSFVHEKQYAMEMAQLLQSARNIRLQSICCCFGIDLLIRLCSIDLNIQLVTASSRRYDLMYFFSFLV